MFHFQVPGYKVYLYGLRAIFGIAGSGLFTIQAYIINKYGGQYY